jgi:hypothetical protein
MKVRIEHASIAVSVIYSADLKRSIQVPIKQMPIILCRWLDFGVIADCQSLN